MKDEQLASLSPRRRQCLRLLHDGLRAKEIARKLGIEEGTVRDHLKASRETVGVSDSLAVARMLVEYERQHPQNVGKHPQAVASAEPDGFSERGSGVAPRSGPDAQVEAFSFPPDPSRAMLSRTGSLGLLSALFPPLDRPPNDLSSRDRIRIIGVEAVIIITAAAGLVGLIILLNWYLTSLSLHGG